MALPYNWYLDYWRPTNFDDAGGTNTQKLSEAEWNQMTPAQQATAIQVNTTGGAAETQSYKDMQGRYQQQFGGDGNIALTGGYLDSKFKDPSANWTDPVTGATATTHDNVRAMKPRLTPAIGLMTVLGAGLGGGLMGLGEAGGAAGATNFAGLGAGALEGGATGLMGGMAPGAAGYLGAGALGAGAAGMGNGGSSAGGWEGVDAPPSSGVNLGDMGAGSLNGAAATGGVPQGGFLSSLQNGATGIGRWALNNPLQAAGLLQTGAGLIGGGGGSPGGGSNYNPTSTFNSGKGGQGQPFSVNPYTLSQLQQRQGAR